MKGKDLKEGTASDEENFFSLHSCSTTEVVITLGSHASSSLFLCVLHTLYLRCWDVPLYCICSPPAVAVTVYSRATSQINFSKVFFRSCTQSIAYTCTFLPQCHTHNMLSLYSAYSFPSIPPGSTHKIPQHVWYSGSLEWNVYAWYF